MSEEKKEEMEILHQSSKEDDDPILEFRNTPVDHLTASAELKGIRFYPATMKELVALCMKKIEEQRSGKAAPGIAHILPLDPFRFTKLRKSKKFRPIAEQSFINLPAASGMKWMSNSLGQPIPERIPIIAFIMNLIRLAQAKEYTIFIVGGTDTVLEKLFFNLKRSFPRLRIVGRHNGYSRGEGMAKVVEALKKTNPHIIILGMGFEKELIWLMENREKLGNSVLINVGGALDIMAGTNRKAPDRVQLNGYTWLWRAFNRPHRWHRIFVILYWFFNVLGWKIFRKKKV